MHLYENFKSALKIQRENGLYRSANPCSTYGKYITVNDKSYINLSSNDYLGIGSDTNFNKEFLHFYASKEIVKLCSSSSRLLTGTTQEYHLLESYIKERTAKSALYLNSGFEANSGVIKTLFDNKDTLLLVDKLSHASIIDGYLACKNAKVMRFLHNDINYLKTLLHTHAKDYSNVVVITESLFSMDGDFASLQKLVDLKQEFPNLILYVDEAHSAGIYGDGLGLCYEQGLLDKVDFVLLTCGKALASSGAILLCEDVVKDYLINFMRPFIFTTAISPICPSIVHYILTQKVELLSKRREKLAHLVATLKTELNGLIFDNNCTLSQIVPIVLGSNENATKGFSYLKEHGFYALPIRYPTVKKGSARLRISLTATLDVEDVKKLCGVIKDLVENLQK